MQFICELSIYNTNVYDHVIITLYCTLILLSVNTIYACILQM